MHITKLSGSPGAVITSIDLNALSDDGFISLRDALLVHGVVVIRNQSLKPEAHMHWQSGLAPSTSTAFSRLSRAIPILLRYANRPI